eukprot:5367543-Pyramimonas_sp.AAC.1
MSRKRLPRGWGRYTFCANAMFWFQTALEIERRTVRRDSRSFGEHTIMQVLACWAAAFTRRLWYATFSGGGSGVSSQLRAASMNWRNSSLL